MEKLKTYVIIISEKFPKTHPKAGEETGFELSIVFSNKIHTIRKNYDLWAKRIKEVQDGKAYLSIRKWRGLPYRSPQEELFRFDKESGVGIEKLQKELHAIWINNKYISSTHEILKTVANNDGLKVEDFCEWFKDVRIEHELAIIHFTPFRYNQ